MWFYTLAACLVFSGIVIADSEPEVKVEGGVLVLTKDNFQHITSANAYILVEFCKLRISICLEVREHNLYCAATISAAQPFQMLRLYLKLNTLYRCTYSVRCNVIIDWPRVGIQHADRHIQSG